MTKLEKIKAILTLAEDEEGRGNDKAAANYRETAFKLAAKHGIEQADLAANGVQAARKQAQRRVMLRRPFNQQWYLLGILSRFCNTYALKYGRDRVELFGYANDVDRCIMLFESLVIQGYSACAREPVPAGEHPPTFRRGWWQLYAYGINERIQAATPRKAGTEIVVRDDAEQYARSQVDKIRKAPPQRINKSYAGREAGYRASKDVDLGIDPKVGGQHKELS